MPKETWNCWLILCPGEDCWELLAVDADTGAEEMFIVCECGYELSWTEAQELHARDAEAATAARRKPARPRVAKAKRKTGQTKTRARGPAARRVPVR